jgi:transposase
MMKVSTIGLDLAKNVFQVHGISDDGTVIVRRRLRRAEVVPFFSSLPPCLVGMEACGTSHYWARELAKLGHEVRMMPPRYVKPYVKRGKNDALDAEAICEAVQRPSMRFVPLKTAEQQGALVIHKTRDLLVRQRAILGQRAAQPFGRVRYRCCQGHRQRRCSRRDRARQDGSAPAGDGAVGALHRGRQH